MSYNPTFLEPKKGTYAEGSAFVAVTVGSDSYVTENDTNEREWNHIERVSKLIRSMTNSGVLNVNDNIVNNNETHLNGFEFEPFASIVNGYLIDNIYYDGEDKNILVALPNPPIADIRYDFVYLECWLKELKENDKVKKYGYINNIEIPFNIIDPRCKAETCRRVQLQWTISHHEDNEKRYIYGFEDADGNLAKIRPTSAIGYRSADYTYEKSKHDENLYIAGEGLISNQKIRTLDGYVYAIPLLLITRINNSGYDSDYNPFGAVDYIDENSLSDRPDGKFANIIYKDQITDLRNIANISKKQYKTTFTTLEEYYTDNTILKNKINRLTHDLKAVDNALKAYGYSIPSLYDLEIYGINMYHQSMASSGASIIDDEETISYYSTHKNYLPERLINKDYAVICTKTDYDYIDKTSVGEVFIEKFNNKYKVRNTGAKGLTLSLEALEADGEVVLSGENVFSGMDGTPLDFDFEVLPSRYFLYVVPLEDAQGKVGVITAKYIDKTIYIYNSGLTSTKDTDFSSEAIDVNVDTFAKGSKFQWVLIDMQSKKWRNINYMTVNMNGQEGTVISSAEFGENYRVMIGTPILGNSASETDMAIGDIYCNVDEEDTITIFNTGKKTNNVTVQCMILNDVNYNEYYDTQSVARIINVPNIVV